MKSKYLLLPVDEDGEKRDLVFTADNFETYFDMKLVSTLSGPRLVVTTIQEIESLHVKSNEYKNLIFWKEKHKQEN